LSARFLFSLLASLSPLARRQRWLTVRVRVPRVRVAAPPVVVVAVAAAVAVVDVAALVAAVLKYVWLHAHL
jgi:hypothetical protein